MKKSQVDKLLIKLNKYPPENIDKEFLNCLIDLDYRIKNLEIKDFTNTGKLTLHGKAKIRRK